MRGKLLGPSIPGNQGSWARDTSQCCTEQKNHSAELGPSSKPTEARKIINHCLKSLSLGIICWKATDKRNRWEVNTGKPDTYRQAWWEWINLNDSPRHIPQPLSPLPLTSYTPTMLNFSRAWSSLFLVLFQPRFRSQICFFWVICLCNAHNSSIYQSVALVSLMALFLHSDDWLIN